MKGYSHQMEEFPIHNVKEVAAMFRCSEEHVRLRVANNTWPHLRDGPRILFTTPHIWEILKVMEVQPKLTHSSRRGQRGRIDRLLQTVSTNQIDKVMNRIG